MTKLNDVKLQDTPALLKTLADYRQKLRVNNSNVLDLTTFVKSLQPNYIGDILTDELLKLDAVLAKRELYYLGEQESVIANFRTQYTVTNPMAYVFPFYSKLLAQALEEDVEALDHIVSTVEHKIDHRFPVLNFDSHSSILSTVLSPADPHYIVTKTGDFKDGNDYNEGLFKSLKNYPIHKRLAEVANRLPQEQFNLILSTQVFSLLAPSHLGDYLFRFYSLLRPGGIALVSFVDVTTSVGFNMLCNWHSNRNDPQFNCITRDYFVEYILKPIKERAPFVIEDDQTFDQHTVLMLRKPGQLKTVKNRKVVFSVKAITE